MLEFSPDCFYSSVRQKAERRHGKMRLEDKKEGVKWVSGEMRAEECAVTGRQR